MDRHLNLFHSYRTAHVEDNVTRALIVALRALSPLHLRMVIKGVLLPEARRDGYDVFAEPDFRFDLQTAPLPPDERLDASNGVLIGLTYTGTQGVVFDDSGPNGGSRPDAVVHDVGNDLVFVVESKKGDHQTTAQLQRHFHHHFKEGTRIEDVYAEVSWTQIVWSLAELRAHTADPKEVFVIGELIDYLDDLGLLDFIGFRHADFQHRNEGKVHSFLSHLHRTLSDSLGLFPYGKNRQVWFDGINVDNVYLHYVEGGLNVGVVCGSGDVEMCRHYRRVVLERPDAFFKALSDFTDSLDPRYDVVLRCHSVLHKSRWRRSLLLNAGGPFAFPGEFDLFTQLVCDPVRNRLNWTPKMEVEQAFGPEITAGHAWYSNEHFSRLAGGEDVLQYLYFHVDVVLPEGDLVGHDPTRATGVVGDLVTKEKALLRSFHSV